MLVYRLLCDYDWCLTDVLRSSAQSAFLDVRSSYLSECMKSSHILKYVFFSLPCIACFLSDCQTVLRHLLLCLLACELGRAGGDVRTIKSPREPPCSFSHIISNRECFGLLLEAKKNLLHVLWKNLPDHS